MKIKMPILVGKLVYKNKKSFLLLLVQMIITIFIFMIIVGKIQYVLETKDITQTFSNENAFYFARYSFYNDSKLDVKGIIEKKYEGNVEVGKISNLFIEIDDNNYQFEQMIGYNDAIISCANFNMKDGVWFNQVEEVDYLPVVTVGDQYHVGEIIPIVSQQKQSIIKAKIIGTLDKEEYILSFVASGSTNNSSLKDFISLMDSAIILPFECEKYPSLQEVDVVDMENEQGEMIIVGQDATPEHIYEALQNYGAVSSIRVMKDVYKNEIYSYFIGNGMILIIFTLITLAGIAGVNGMQSILNERLFSIYYMLGLTRRNCAFMEALRSLALIISAFSIVLILYSLGPIRAIFFSGEQIINGVTFLFVLCYLFLIYICTSLRFVLKFGRQDLIQTYRESIE